MDAVAQLLARDQHGVKFGLESIKTLCAALDHPERAYETLIVAGTNGKGSVVAMTAAALTASGYRTGRYTSPHLVRVEERFAIDGLPAAHDAVGAAASLVLDAERRCRERGDLEAPVTFFEIATATAFVLFRTAGVSVAVLEVGMGGRLDATNAADPAVGAITSIAFDHMRFLGDTLAAIAREKAGILRGSRPCVLGPLPSEAAQVIGEVAAERGAILVDAFDGVACDAELHDGRATLRLRTPACDYGQVTLALPGRHQVANAVVAVRLLEEARRANLIADGEAVTRGLQSARWPARLEEVDTPGGGRVLLDAAHNPAGAASLAAYLRDRATGRVPIVFGAMRDKDVRGMLELLAPQASRLLLTRAHSPRAMPPAELRATAASLQLQVPIETYEHPGEALTRAREDAPYVVVAGSMFLVGDLLAEGFIRSDQPAPHER